MSNIALFKSGAVIPSYLTSGTDDLAKQLAGTTSSRSISIKGGTFRMVQGKEELAKIDDRFLNVIILAAQPKVGREYYEGKFKEGVDTPIACWSADGDTPSKDAAKPQSSKCATCIQNIEGSGEGKSRACRFSQRIAVLLENDPSGEVYRVKLPAKSIFGKSVPGKMPLQAYARHLSGHGVPMGGVVTEMRFNTDEAVPVLVFAATRPLEQAEYDTVRERAMSEDAKEAIAVTYPKAKEGEQEAPAAALYSEPSTPAKAAPQEEPATEPTVRKSSKKAEPVPASSGAQSALDVMNDWVDDDAE